MSYLISAVPEKTWQARHGKARRGKVLAACSLCAVLVFVDHCLAVRAVPRRSVSETIGEVYAYVSRSAEVGGWVRGSVCRRAWGTVDLA